MTMVLSSTPLRADECEAPKPVKISGAFCGRVFEPNGGVLQEAEIRLLDATGTIVGETSSAANGDFKFRALPEGTYRVAITGWRIFGSTIEITAGKSANCKTVSVHAGLTYCEGHVDPRRPR